MQPLSVQTSSRSDGLFSSIPTELMTNTFCLLPSFIDVLSLAATCHRLRNVWNTNITSIYRHVAPKSIPCERYARAFLADQGGPALDSPTLSAQDVACMLRNSCVVEKAILQFEREIVSKVKTNGFPYEELERYYGAGARGHPPTLTRTERLRFIRSYYQIWGLMKLDPAEWQSKLEPMTLKQLYLLYEMSDLPQSIGREDSVPDVELGSIYNINNGQSDKCIALRKKIWQYTESTYQRICKRDPEPIWAHAIYAGALGFLVIWDHWQLSLWEVICGRRRREATPRSSFEKQYVWDDSSDEEVPS